MVAWPANGDGESVTQGHHVARAQKKPLHSGGFRVIGDEKLDGVTFVGRSLEQLAGRGEPLREQLVASGGIRIEAPSLAGRKPRLAGRIAFRRGDGLEGLLQGKLAFEG